MSNKKTSNGKKPNPTPAKKIVKAKTSNDTQTTITETLEPEIVTETQEPEIVTENPETPTNVQVTETVKDTSRRVFWHKACSDEKKSTITKMKPNDVLTYTENKVSDPNGNVKPVLSLKRGKRIYYLSDYTPEELTSAQQTFNDKKALKEAEEKAKASSETSK